MTILPTEAQHYLQLNANIFMYYNQQWDTLNIDLNKTDEQYKIKLITYYIRSKTYSVLFV